MKLLHSFTRKVKEKCELRKPREKWRCQFDKMRGEKDDQQECKTQKLQKLNEHKKNT